MEDSMDKEGRISDVAPAYWAFYNESIVWPSSFFLVANMLYLQYGDEEVIRKHYPAMKRWIRHMDTFIKDDLMPLDTYGDWCVPPKSPTQIFSDDPAAKTTGEILGTSYYYHVLRLMSRFAVISGHSEDKLAFDESGSRMKAAFNQKHFRAEKGQYDNGTQTSSILPLAVGLAPEDHRPAIFDALIRNIETTAKGHVATGLVGGQWLMQTLTENGRGDVACKIASQTTYPSWGYMLRRGATTIWELWNGDTANPAMNSGNHLMLLGDFSSWLYEDLAGIKSDPDHPGFKHIIVRPRVTGDLKFVKASHRSPYGEIATSWRYEGDSFTLHVSVPPNTSADVYVPAPERSAVLENGKAAEASMGVRFLRRTPDATVYEIGSGEYVFTSKLSRT
jgi:alpha-L-rhamnosidase